MFVVFVAHTTLLLAVIFCNEID